MRRPAAWLLAAITAGLVLMALLWAGESHADLYPRFRQRALVIGISDYSGQGWANLPAARRDAKDLGELLQSAYGFDVQMLLDKAATQEQIYQRIGALLDGPTAQATDHVVLFYAGHGAQRGETAFWIPADVGTRDTSLLYSKGVSAPNIHQMVRTARVAKVLVLVDTCYSGGFAWTRGPDPAEASRTVEAYERDYASPSVEVITAGGAAPVSDDIILKATRRSLTDGHSPFTYHLLRQLRAGGPLGYLSGLELAAELSMAVKAATVDTDYPQVPEYAHRLRDGTPGTFVFMKRGASSEGSGAGGPDRGEVISQARGAVLTLELASAVGGVLYQDGDVVPPPLSGPGSWRVGLSEGRHSFRLEALCLGKPVYYTRTVTANQLGGGDRWDLVSAEGVSAGCKAAMTMAWVSLPGGTFMMGSGKRDRDAQDDERPAHLVEVSPFLLSKTEVTVAQYEACVRAGACTAPIGFKEDSNYNWQAPGREEHPINRVSWEEAAAFATWVGGALPTEAQWEWAARGEAGRRYPWGSEPPDCGRAVMDLDDDLDNDNAGCGASMTAPVCSRPSGNTPEGACDLGGNVMEWTADGYDPKYYATLPAPPEVSADPTGPALAPPGGSFGVLRVIRGGSWIYGARSLRAADRATLPQKIGLHSVGFRVALPALPNP